MFGLSKPLLLVIAALLVTNGVTAWTTKLYHARFSAAVAECDTDKLRSALEAEQATSEALRGSVRALAEIRARETAAADLALTEAYVRSEEIYEELQRVRARLDREIEGSSDRCLVNHVPERVWRAVRGDSDGAGGGAGTGSDPAS